MKAVSYVLPLASEARLRVEFRKRRGKIQEFLVQLEIHQEGNWVPVVRYDTAHGIAHRDSYRRDGSVNRHEPLPVADFNEALTFAEADLKQNWQEWIEKFRRKRS